jgi:hypothetical protein
MSIDDFRKAIENLAKRIRALEVRDRPINGQLSAAEAFYVGDPATDGSWRIIRSGNNLLMERREIGAWVTKHTVTP